MQMRRTRVSEPVIFSVLQTFFSFLAVSSDTGFGALSPPGAAASAPAEPRRHVAAMAPKSLAMISIALSCEHRIPAAFGCREAFHGFPCMAVDRHPGLLERVPATRRRP